MTREEAIKILRKEIECLSHTKCEDCILEAACDPIKTTPYDSEYIEVYEMAITALEQEPKTGHWDDIPKYKDIAWQCHECRYFTTMKHNYCPSCGAKMVDPQESEDKE